MFIEYYKDITDIFVRHIVNLHFCNISAMLQSVILQHGSNIASIFCCMESDMLKSSGHPVTEKIK